MSISRTNLNVTAVLRRLEALEKATPKSLESAVKAEGEAVFAASQPLVPVDSGDLLASGKVVVASTTKQATATISYGSATVTYAAERHESPHSANRKYLERPLFDAVPGIAERLASHVETKLWHSE